MSTKNLANRDGLAVLMALNDSDNFGDDSTPWSLDASGARNAVSMGDPRPPSELPPSPCHSPEQNRTFPMTSAARRNEELFGGGFDPREYKANLRQERRDLLAEKRRMLEQSSGREYSIDYKSPEDCGLFPEGASPPPSPSRITFNLSPAAALNTTVNIGHERIFGPPSFSMAAAAQSTPIKGAGTPPRMDRYWPSGISSMYDTASCGASPGTPSFHTARSHLADVSILTQGGGKCPISPIQAMESPPPCAVNATMNYGPPASNASHCSGSPGMQSARSHSPGNASMSSPTKCQIRQTVLNLTDSMAENENQAMRERLRCFQNARRQRLSQSMMNRRKQIQKQQVVIPKGFILPGEAAVIEIPRRFEKSPVVVVKRRDNEFAHARASSYFIRAPEDVQDPYAAQTVPKVAFSPKQPHTRQEILNHLDRTQGGPEAPPGPMYYGPPPVVPQPNYGRPQSGLNLPPQPQYMPQPGFAAPPGGMNLPAQSPMPQSPFVPTQSPVNVPPQQQVTTQPMYGATPQVPFQPQILPEPSYGVMQAGSVPQQQLPQVPSSYLQYNVCPGRQTETLFMQPPTFYTPQMYQPECSVNLASQEKMEKSAFTKSLEEYQRARRNFLANTKSLTTKASKTSTSSCDSCY